MKNINNLIERVEKILSDIEHRKIESIGSRYKELKTQVESEIKSLTKETELSTFNETIYLPALNEFFLSLKPKTNSSNHSQIYDALLDGLGLLNWYAKQ